MSPIPLPRRIHAFLCTPSLLQLTGHAHVHFVVEGPLQALPFPALLDEGGTPLGHRLRCTHSPDWPPPNIADWP